MDEIRLNKFLSESGVCSRREADRLIEDGRVTVDGQPASVGQKVADGARILVDGKVVLKASRPVLLAVYKPRGIVCTTARSDPDNIIDYLKYPMRIFPVGRLDKQSEGLLLMTNQGSLVNKILRAGNAHEKEYIVRTDRPVREEFLEKMREGVPILDTVTLPCEAEQLTAFKFRIVLHQGLNRQIRRMCEALGREVRWLKRVRIMNITLGNMKPGDVREIRGEELAELMRLLEGSTDRPYAETLQEDPAYDDEA